MNILYLCDEYPPCKHGGIGTATRILAQEIVRKGHQVVVCGFYPYYRKALPFENDNGVKVFRRFYGNWLLLKLSRNKYYGHIVNCEKKFQEYINFLRKVINDYHIEIIEIPDFNEVFRYTGPRFVEFPDFGIPKIIKLHGTYSFVNNVADGTSVEKWILKKERKLIQDATKILAVSEFAEKITREIFKYPNKTTVIHNGISINDTIIYKEYLKDKPVVFAGKLTRQKGIFSLIKAWEYVIAELPSAKLFIYGEGGKKDLESLNRIISEENRKSIDFKGLVNRSILPEIYSMASCAVFPSYAETFGMATMESMQVGCPTIFTKKASGEELITNGIDGLLVDPDNPKEIADAIIYMLKNRDSARLIGKNGAKTIREKFDIRIIALKHLEFYSDLLEN